MFYYYRPIDFTFSAQEIGVYYLFDREGGTRAVMENNRHFLKEFLHTFTRVSAKCHIYATKSLRFSLDIYGNGIL